MTSTPYSLRLPLEMRDALTQWAEHDRRTLHSLILVLLDDALQVHRAESRATANAANAYRPVPTVRVLTASLPESAG